jgi:DNA-binding NarL/FixJ family response regulator
MQTIESSVEAVASPAECAKRRVMIVDDHPVLREGVAIMLRFESDLELTHEAGSAEQALALLATVRPDLLLLDISLQGTNGLELIQQILELHPGLRILILSAFDEGRYAEQALKAGASGYLMKSEPRATLLEALRCVLRGDYYLNPAIAPRLLHSLLHRDSAAAPALEQVLSERELEIFAMIGKGLETQVIARRLFVSPKTIRAHRNNIMRKLKLKGTIQLYQSAFKWLQEKTGGPLYFERTTSVAPPQ